MTKQPRFTIPTDFDLERVEPGPVSIIRIQRDAKPTVAARVEWFCYGLTVGVVGGCCLMMWIASKF